MREREVELNQLSTLHIVSYSFVQYFCLKCKVGMSTAIS